MNDSRVDHEGVRGHVGNPVGPFEDQNPPPEPSYAEAANWAALPWHRNPACLVPVDSGIRDRQQSAQVDTFFVHPTSYFGRRWNAPATSRVIHFVTSRTMAVQASVFNGIARVYAPRYRQMTLAGFDHPGPREKALALAYSDVKRAFVFFLEHFNQGRPLILAGHSQGSRLLLRLIDELFTGGELRDRLIAAYIVGARVWDGPFKRGQATLPVCRGPQDTGCLLSWRTFAEGADPSRDMHAGEPADGHTICVNPLSGSCDEEPVSSEKNLGSVSLLHIWRPTAPVRALVGAQCRDGILWVHRPKEWLFRIAAGDGNYHPYDYHLFYLNVRADAERRVEAFLRLH